MDVDRARGLPQLRGGIAEGVLDEQRFAREAGQGIELVDIELVLALDRNEDPWLARVAVKMPRPELHAVAGLDRRDVGEHAAPEAEGLDRARVYRVVDRRVVAARHQHDLTIVGRGEDLVRIFAFVERIGLADAFAERTVAVDAMHGEAAWIVIGGEQIFAGAVDAGVDRPRGQRQLRAMRRQRAGCRVDLKCIREMPVAGDARRARAAIAGDDIEIAFRRMRPGILDLGRRRDRPAPGERSFAGVDAVERKLRPDGRVEHIP